MSDQNKEFPSFLGHETKPRVETNEPIEDGVIIEQPITAPERAELENELQQAEPSEAEPSLADRAVVEHAPVSNQTTLETSVDHQTTDHVATKLKEDNPFDNVTAAHDAVNALLRGETKP